MNFVDPAETWIVPQWAAPANVRALITTRAGGVSTGAWSDGRGGGGMNLGLSSGDDRHAVQANRARLAARLPQAPRWLAQVHGNTVVSAESVPCAPDAADQAAPGVVCAVQIADCMPVLLTDAAGTVVAAVHAGWRGLAAGVIQNAVRAMRTRSGDSELRVVAYLGPAIGPRHFEVGADVLEAMRPSLPDAEHAFVAMGREKYWCDLFALGKQALAQVSVDQVFGGADCTYSDRARFFSFRRDQVTGRHAALIWITTTAARV
jgi:YfiH family protein